MYSLPDMDTLDTTERQHIETVLQKVEQRQAPYVLSQISKSRSAGERLEEYAARTIDQESEELSAAELEHIARVQEMIALAEAESDVCQKPQEQEEKTTTRFGFKMGASLKDALKKMNENVSTIAGAIEKPAPPHLKGLSIGESLKKLAAKGVGEKGEVWGINRGWKSGREVVKR
jgi:hypothetical protein